MSMKLMAKFCTSQMLSGANHVVMLAVGVFSNVLMASVASVEFSK